MVTVRGNIKLTLLLSLNRPTQIFAMSTPDHPTVGDSPAVPPAENPLLDVLRNIRPNPPASANRAIEHKQKKGKHRITKRGTNSREEAITQMKAKR